MSQQYHVMRAYVTSYDPEPEQPTNTEENSNGEIKETNGNQKDGQEGGS